MRRSCWRYSIGGSWNYGPEDSSLEDALANWAGLGGVADPGDIIMSATSIGPDMGFRPCALSLYAAQVLYRFPDSWLVFDAGYKPQVTTPGLRPVVLNL